MKIKNIASIAAAALLSMSLTGCLKETFPTSVITQSQLEQSDNALAALSRASAASLNRYYSSVYSEFGYPAIMLWRDTMGAEMPISGTSYDYHGYYAQCLYLGDYAVQYAWWSLYYKIIFNANLLISSVDESKASEDALHYLGNALCYRAFAYFDLARMYEFHKTGYAALDDDASERGIYGLTVPIHTEKTTEAESKNLERAPFTQMYRFILTDLDHAEKLLAGYTPSEVNMAGADVVAGLKARVWLELASRFDASVNTDAASDLQTAMAAESSYPELSKFGIKSASDCYTLASTYAQKVMAGHTPLTQEEWYDTSKGFNSPCSSWVFGMMIGQEDVGGSWKSFTANISPEQTYGTANYLYDGFRLIDASLYKKIGDGDWRRNTWVAPGDAGKKSAYSKYETLLSDSLWVKSPAYANFKFRPGSGNMTNYLVGNAVSIPLMRVEEMYLIDAEAKAHTLGLNEGKKALEGFLNGFRYSEGSKYASTSTSLSDFSREILTQRRIELWGEGLVIFDYRRLKIAVKRGYSGTNFPDSYRYNSLEGYVAPWSTIYITSGEYQYNHALDNKLNPDASSYGELYTD